MMYYTIIKVFVSSVRYKQKLEWKYPFLYRESEVNMGERLKGKLL